MILTMTGREFFESDDTICIIHYSAGREKFIMPSDGFEIYYAAHGTGFFHFDNQEILVEEGDIFLINPNSSCYFTSYKEDNRLSLELYYCKFLYPPTNNTSSTVPTYTNFSNIAADFSFDYRLTEHLDSTPYLMIKDMPDKLIRNLFIKLIHEFTSRPNGYQILLTSYLNELLTYLFRKYEEDLTGQKSGIPENTNHVVTNIIKYIQCNYQRELYLDDISNHFYMSNSYLSKLFKKHTGITVLDYIQTLRLEKVCDLLRNTDRIIDNIAMRVGYSSTNYLQKLFKEKIGITMVEYRKKYRP